MTLERERERELKEGDLERERARMREKVCVCMCVRGAETERVLELERVCMQCVHNQPDIKWRSYMHKIKIIVCS